MTRTLSLALAAAVVVSGCSGPPSSGTDPIATPSSAGSIPSATASETPGSATGPSVSATDQSLRDEAVSVAVVVDAPAFVVLHLAQEGAPGDVVGHAAVEPGSTDDLAVPVDVQLTAGDVLWAMVHTDAGEVGSYEFPGPDVPLRDADGAVVMTPFEITDED